MQAVVEGMVIYMTAAKRETSKWPMAPKYLDFFDQVFNSWPRLDRPILVWQDRGVDPLRVDEFTEDGILFIRIEVAGIDPEEDVEISVKGDMLHIGVERREEEKTDERDYVRRELHYGSFQRDLPVPKGTTDTDVKASYKDGLLEIRIPMPKAGVETTKRIPVAKS